MNNENYINIQGWMINKLKLKGNELIVYAVIYGFSQDGKSEYFGSYRYIAKALSLTERSVQDIIKKLLGKKLIKRTSESHYKVEEFSMEKNSTGVEESSTMGRRKFHKGVEETTTNNNKDNNKDNNTSDKSQDNPSYIPIPELIDLFKDINASYKTFFANKTERSASKSLLEVHSFEEIKERLKYVRRYNQVPFLSRYDKIYKPSDLLRNWSVMEDHLVSLKQKVNSNTLEEV